MTLLRGTWMLLVLATGALCRWNAPESEEKSSVEFQDEDEKAAAIYDQVVSHAPYLRFHEQEGSSGFCFPHNASSYYALRAADDWSRQCNEDYSSIQNGDIPTYYHAMECGRHLHVAYWNFYGYNHDCDCCSGERDAWWEFMVVKIRKWAGNTKLMHEVMFGQKDGWYTRQKPHYEVYNRTHPVAYVGRSSHGLYHDDGGINTCCYFDDTRNPGEPNRNMKTWKNLVELRQDTDAEEWMTDPSSHLWNGIFPPTLRDDWDLCNLKGCEGAFVKLCSTSGCYKSDIGEDPF